MRLPSLIRLVVLVVIGAVPVAGQVQAQRLNIDAFLQQWDTDHDGTLSVDEIKKAAIARFEELDRNHKDRLSRNQLAGVLTFQQFRQADKDKDGTLDKDEFQSAVEKPFQAADKDHDGTLEKKVIRCAARTNYVGQALAPVSLRGVTGSLLFAACRNKPPGLGSRLAFFPGHTSRKGLHGGRIGWPRDWVAQRPRAEA